MRVLMVAAENAALAGVKVGGIGDVLRDAPVALAERGCQVDVVTPGYGFVSVKNKSLSRSTLKVDFAGAVENVALDRLSLPDVNPKVRYWAIDHPLLAANGEGRLYFHDSPSSPFATDATRFALFCAGVCEAMSVQAFGTLDVIHLHDWHTALVLVLRKFRPKYEPLNKIKSVYTIHNIAVQGVRPLRNHPSSLHAWYPDLEFDPKLLCDPRWPDCVNPMAVGIRMADKVHTVSPTYAREICLPSQVETEGFYGGEGLQDDLIKARDKNRLHGILNGCSVANLRASRLPWRRLCAAMDRQLLAWAADEQDLQSAGYIAHRRIEALADNRPKFLLTSVGRITEQKVRLFFVPTSQGDTALERILGLLGKHGSLVLLGSGNAEYERDLRRYSARHANFVFLRGYAAEQLAHHLYASGDLFLMPSSYEPCGISQMLAMRAGQPCLAHAVGGLKDTVKAGQGGFTFNGKSMVQQADQFVAAFEHAFKQFTRHPSKWKKLCKSAASQRFSWDKSVAAYLKSLYT